MEIEVLDNGPSDITSLEDLKGLWLSEDGKTGMYIVVENDVATVYDVAYFGEKYGLLYDEAESVTLELNINEKKYSVKSNGTEVVGGSYTNTTITPITITLTPNESTESESYTYSNKTVGKYSSDDMDATFESMTLKLNFDANPDIKKITYKINGEEDEDEITGETLSLTLYDFEADDNGKFAITEFKGLKEDESEVESIDPMKKSFTFDFAKDTTFETPEFMTLTLDYNGLSAANDVATVTVQYGNGADKGTDEQKTEALKYYLTVNATVDSNTKTATARLAKTKGDDWGWFNAVTFTLKDASDNEIDAKWTCSASGGGANFFQFDPNGVTMSATTPSSEPETGTLTITLSKFPETPAIGKVMVSYGHDSNWTESAEATLSQDKKSATIEISSAYANDSGYFDTKITVYQEDGTTEIKSKNPSSDWPKFSTSGMSVTAEWVDESEKWISILTDHTFAAIETLVEIVASTNMPQNIAKLKVDVKKTNTTSKWWASIGTANVTVGENNTFENEVKLTWTDDLPGYTTIVEDSTLIQAFQAKGIMLAGGDFIVTVSYVAAQ